MARLAGVVVLESSALIRARMKAAVLGLDPNLSARATNWRGERQPDPEGNDRQAVRRQRSTPAATYRHAEEIATA
jgi:hypothetical protein